MKAENSLLFHLLSKCVRLYPRDFQARFADELLQTCSDCLYNQPVGNTGFWLGTFSDLLRSILHEWMGEARKRMRLSNVLKGFGFLLMALWFAGFLMITGAGLLNWMFSDTMRSALDRAFSNSAAMSLGTGLMAMAPLVAFLAFMIPQLRVHVNGANGSLEIKVLSMGRYSTQMILLSGVLSLIILVIFLAALL